MKKLLFILFFVAAQIANSVYAQKTIPSWGVPVYYRANFFELYDAPLLSTVRYKKSITDLISWLCCREFEIYAPWRI